MRTFKEKKEEETESDRPLRIREDRLPRKRAEPRDTMVIKKSSPCYSSTEAW